MKKILFLLGFVSTTCFGQDIPCPPSGSTSVGQIPPTNTPFTPPNNPDHPRATPFFPDDRIIYWIHGLGGGPDSWARVAEATMYQAPGQTVPGYPHRKVTSVPLTYSQFSLSGAAGSLHNMLVSTGDPLCNANHITDKTINFIIAHSQGGIVSRATDKMYDDLGIPEERRFGGIVTFGTPHGGAMIINNKEDIYKFSGEGCNALSSGPIDDAIQKKPFVDFFVPNEILENTISGLCSFVEEQILPIAFKDQLNDISEDYKVGAAPLNELNSHHSGIPHVALYGVEEEPVLYRTMYNLKVKTPNQFPVFGADNDSPLVDKFNTLLNKYKAQYELYRNRVEYLEDMGLPCDGAEWFCCTAYCIVWDTEYWQKKAKRDKWADGYYWLRDSNNQYKAIIGAYETEWVTTYQCACDGYTYPTNQPVCATGCQLSFMGGFVKEINHPNDGVVTAASASAYPGAVIASMEKSNHQQMRNDSNTKARMLELLDGGFGNYFETKVR